MTDPVTDGCGAVRVIPLNTAADRDMRLGRRLHSNDLLE
jgi:hypothetical protein